MNRNPYQGDDVDPFSATRDEESGAAPVADQPAGNDPRRFMMNPNKTTIDVVEAEPPKKMSFSQAFAAARRSGDKTFEWNGKKYTTDVAPAPQKQTHRRTSGADRGPDVAPSAKREQSIYDLDRDPLVKQWREARKEVAAKGPFEPYRGKTAEDRQKAMRGYAKGGSVGSASKRADGCASKGKTKGKIY